MIRINGELTFLEEGNSMSILSVLFLVSVFVKAKHLLFYSSCTDKESHVLLEIIVHNPVVIDISTLSIPSAIHEAVPSVPSFCLEQRTHIRIFLIFPLSIYLKTRR